MGGGGLAEGNARTQMKLKLLESWCVMEIDDKIALSHERKSVCVDGLVEFVDMARPQRILDAHSSR